MCSTFSTPQFVVLSQWITETPTNIQIAITYYENQKKRFISVRKLGKKIVVEFEIK